MTVIKVWRRPDLGLYFVPPKHVESYEIESIIGRHANRQIYSLFSRGSLVDEDSGTSMCSSISNTSTG